MELDHFNKPFIKNIRIKSPARKIFWVFSPRYSQNYILSRKVNPKMFTIRVFFFKNQGTFFNFWTREKEASLVSLEQSLKVSSCWEKCRIIAKKNAILKLNYQIKYWRKKNAILKLNYQIKCWPLIWIFPTIQTSHKINWLHERGVEIVCNNYFSSFRDFLNKNYL